MRNSNRAPDLCTRLQSAPRISATLLPNTFLTVGLSILHVEEAIPKRLPAGSADKASGMPSLPQGMHHFLKGKRADGWCAPLKHVHFRNKQELKQKSRATSFASIAQLLLLWKQGGKKLGEKGGKHLSLPPLTVANCFSPAKAAQESVVGVKLVFRRVC